MIIWMKNYEKNLFPKSEYSMIIWMINDILEAEIKGVGAHRLIDYSSRRLGEEKTNYLTNYKLNKGSILRTPT